MQRITSATLVTLFALAGLTATTAVSAPPAGAAVVTVPNGITTTDLTAPGSSAAALAQALVGTGVTLALLPCGSGNGLARHLGIPLAIGQLFSIDDEQRIVAAWVEILADLIEGRLGGLPVDRSRLFRCLVVARQELIEAELFGHEAGAFTGATKARVGRFEEAVAVRHFVIGLAKAPFFAMIIAMVGCYQGFQIRGGVDDVGRHTTISVVQSIFLVIIFDAICSILLNWWDL